MEERQNDALPRFTHDDGRECWWQNGDWYYRTGSAELESVGVTAKPYAALCDRHHEEANDGTS